MGPAAVEFCMQGIDGGFTAGDGTAVMIGPRLAMKTGIIGLPQVGKTSLFRILTKAKVDDRGYTRPGEAHLGIAKVPDERLDKLAELFKPKKLIHATIEYSDVAAIAPGSAQGIGLFQFAAHGETLWIHVRRAWDAPSIPHVGVYNAVRDAMNVEFVLIVSDLGQVE